MERPAIDETEIQSIIDSLKNFKIDIEGKKPLKSEIVLHYLTQISEINANLSSSKEVIEKFNNEFSNILTDLINKYDTKTSQIIEISGKIDTKFEKLMESESRAENLTLREKSVEETLNNANQIIQSGSDLKSLFEESKSSLSSVEILVSKLTEVSKSMKLKSKVLEDKIDLFNSKIDDLFSQQEKLNVEKEKLLVAQTILKEKETSIEEKDQRVNKIEQNLKILENTLLEKESEIKTIQANLVTVSTDTLSIFDEVKLAQTQIMQTMTETTELLSEKTYLYKLEDDLKAKEEELKKNITKYDTDKEILSSQISKFTVMLDKTSNNLSLNEMTTEMLGNAVTHFNSQVKTIGSISKTMDDQIKNIHSEREEYQRLGNLITDQLNEINKQSEGMMKLNVLSTYIHQTILELREAESSLKLLIENSSLNTKENQEISKNINQFLGSAGKLFDSTQQQIEAFALTNENLRSSRNDLIDVQFQLKQKSKELEKVGIKLDSKENKLMEIEKKILDQSMEQKLASKENEKIKK
ncbi:MAG: Chromosome partition protein Smc [Candidatus Heimdallarchaeota archaeon LC_2]|nr:MAG: Chromosome partition protein Smc [Candidatus Heimdallarchaeota archaeon LC_2]